MFQRARWTKFEKSYEFFGLLALCHGLLQPVMLDYLGAILPSQPAAPQAAAPVVDGEEQAVDGVAGDDNVDFKTEMDVMTNNIDWKAFNTRMRTKLEVWVRTNPGAVLLIVALSLRPLQNMMHRFLFRGGLEWEQQQRARAAQSAQSAQSAEAAETAESGDVPHRGRTDSVLEACRGTDLQAYHSDVNACFHSNVVGIPKCQHFLRHQVLLFRILSAEMCAVQWYVHVAWRGYPVQLFGCLDNNYSVATAPPCVLDPLAKAILQKYPDEQALQSADCRAALQCLASRFAMDIAALEARHASTRRLTVVRGVQTKKPSLETLSAEWICRSNALNRLDLLGPPVKDEDAEAGVGDDKEKVRRANPWSSFLSEHSGKFSSHGDKSQKRLAEAFRDLDPEEKARFRKSAELSKLAAERGLRDEGAVDAVSSSQSRSQLLQVANLPLGLDTDLQAALQIVSQETSVRLKAVEDEQKALELAIAEHRQDTDGISHVLADFPAMLESSRPALVGLQGRTVHIPADTFAEAEFES